MRIDRNRWLAGWLLCAGLALPAVLFHASAAPATGEPAAATANPRPEDAFGRETPYGTVMGFTVSAAREDYQRAAGYLEGPQSAERKAELARMLQVVLNRGLQIRIDSLSREPRGHLDDGLAPDLEKVGEGRFAGESLDIVLRRVADKDAAPVWLFSSQTLKGVPRAAENLDATWGESLWTESFRKQEFLTLPVFVLLNWLALLPLLAAAAWLLARGVRALLRPSLLNRVRAAEHDIAAITGALAFVIFSLLLGALAPMASTLRSRLFFTGLAAVLISLAFTWMLIMVTKLVAEVRIVRLRQSGALSRIPAVRLMSWVVMVLWAFAGLVLVVRSLGLDPTATLAGLGVGGIAIAFAAQKTIENLFGTLMVIGDEAVRIGDRCQVGNVDGWVESIGLRSTQIRTADRTLVSIPNGQLAAMNVANLQRRDKMLFQHRLRLRSDTSAAQARRVLDDVRALLSRHPQVEQATHSTRLVGFGESSLNLDVSAYLLTRDGAAFLEIQEELLLTIMDLLDASGTRIALPTDTVHAHGAPHQG